MTGTGPLGCVPAELALRSRDGNCVPELQRAAALFNPQLAQLIKDLNHELRADVFIAANAFTMHMDFISSPQSYGKLSACGFSVVCRVFLYLRFSPGRFYYVEGGMLRARAIQRDRAMYGGVERVHEQGYLRFLGRLPSVGEGEPDHREPVPERVPRLYEPHEPQHYPRDGQRRLVLRRLTMSAPRSIFLLSGLLALSMDVFQNSRPTNSWMHLQTE